MNDRDQSRLLDAEYERMEWLETKEDRGTMTLDEKKELIGLHNRWNRRNHGILET